MANRYSFGLVNDWTVLLRLLVFMVLFAGLLVLFAIWCCSLDSMIFAHQMTDPMA